MPFLARTNHTPSERSRFASSLHAVCSELEGRSDLSAQIDAVSRRSRSSRAHSVHITEQDVLPAVLPSRHGRTTEAVDLTAPRPRRRDRPRRRQQGTSVSAWLADTAAHRLRLEAGRQGIAEWERQHGPLTADELADGLARARRLLGRSPTSRRTA